MLTRLLHSLNAPPVSLLFGAKELRKSKQFLCLLSL